MFKLKSLKWNFDLKIRFAPIIKKFCNKPHKPEELLPLDKKIDPSELMKRISLERLTKERNGDLIENPSKEIEKKRLTRAEELELFKKRLEEKEKVDYEKKKYKMRVAWSLFALLIGGFSLWVPLYRTICERKGFSVTTHQKKYIFAPEKMKVHKKFTVNFIHEVDVELPWEFEALQKSVVVNAGETCLAFYRIRNKTDKPIVGLSVYDVHPQTLAMYFNKIQCFCFENQMLGPNEEVDLPVFFYIDPSVNDDMLIDEFREINLKYTFYMAKRQELAKIVEKHLNKNREDQEKLRSWKKELNEKHGKNYTIDNNEEERFTPLPGLNQFTAQNLVEESKN